MKIRLSVTALNEAFDVISIVPPKPVTQEDGAGFLITVRGGKCFIYSRDAIHQARVEVAFDPDGSEEGSFIFPADKVAALRFLDGWIQLESGVTDDRHWIHYETEGGAKQDLTTFDARMMQSIDSAFEKTTPAGTFPAALLRDAMNTTKGYLAKAASSADDHFKTLQLFDQSQEAWKKGDGHFLAADSIRACFYYCSELKEKGLSLHGQHLPFLTSFLSRSEGDVTVRQGDGLTFVVNSKNQILGWAHAVKQHPKFNYYPPSRDTFVLKVPRDLLLKALRYVRAGLDSKKDKIRVQYTFSDLSLRFLASESAGKTTSMPVGVKPISEGEGGGGASSDNADFAFNVSLNQFIELFDGMRTHDPDLRVAIIPEAPGRKASALFRTIESFWLDEHGKPLIAPQDAGENGKAFQCQVTRFMPSRE